MPTSSTSPSSPLSHADPPFGWIVHELPPLAEGRANYVGIALVTRVPANAPPLGLRWHDVVVPLPWTWAVGDLFRDLLSWAEAGLDREPVGLALHTHSLAAEVRVTFPSPDTIESRVIWHHVRDAAPSAEPAVLDTGAWADTWRPLTSRLLAILDGFTTDPKLERLRRLDQRLAQSQR